MRPPCSLRLGIIGDPIERSLSPALHSYALQCLGIEGEYRAYQVKSEALQDFLEAHRDLWGFNVTIPHKESIIAYLDELDGSARRIGAVNTVRKQPYGRFVGYNTDSVGFLRSLQAHGFAPQGKRAIIIGAGGAARAVAHALLSSDIDSLTIYNRTVSRAQRLVEELQHCYSHRGISVGTEPQALSSADLVVNTTPAGTIPLPECLSEGALAYDLAYNPPQTQFLAEAAQRGAQTLNGLDMLISQALESLKIWLGAPDLEERLEYESLKRFLEEKLKEHL